MLVGNSPFVRASKDDFYYSLLISNNSDYWKLTGYSLDDDSKDLILKMIKYDPLERIDLKSVLNHRFLKGEIANIEEVNKYFSCL